MMENQQKFEKHRSKEDMERRQRADMESIIKAYPEIYKRNGKNEKHVKQDSDKTVDADPVNDI